MPDWSSAEEIALDASAFMKMVHALSGFYLWEVILSITFEWEFITGVKKFTWPAMFYFLGRYSAVAMVVGTLASIDALSEVNCQSLYTFLAIAGQFTIGFATVNLAIRVMAMWDMDLYCIVPLVVLILGHWAVLMQGVVITASWVPDVGCSVTKTNTQMLMVSFIYTACFMLVLLVVAFVKLVIMPHKRPRFLDVMTHEGLQYYIIALLANIPPAAVLALNLNPIMNVIFDFPSGVVFVTVACRSIRQLSNRTTDTPWFIDPARINSSLAFKSSEREPTAGGISLGTSRRATGVHVHMDTYIVEDNVSEYEANKKGGLSVGNGSGDEHAL